MAEVAEGRVRAQDLELKAVAASGLGEFNSALRSYASGITTLVSFLTHAENPLPVFVLWLSSSRSHNVIHLCLLRPSLSHG